MRCPHCGKVIRIMALIEDPPVIEKILKHLHLWDYRPPSQVPPADDLGWPENSQIPITYALLPDIVQRLNLARPAAFDYCCPERWR